MFGGGPDSLAVPKRPPQSRAWVKVEEMKRSRSEICAMVVTSAGLLAVWGGLAVLAVVLFLR
jgi:hypothetical protein